jgi:hypothetical protein
MSVTSTGIPNFFTVDAREQRKQDALAEFPALKAIIPSGFMEMIGSRETGLNTVDSDYDFAVNASWLIQDGRFKEVEDKLRAAGFQDNSVYERCSVEADFAAMNPGVLSVYTHHFLNARKVDLILCEDEAFRARVRTAACIRSLVDEGHPTVRDFVGGLKGNAKAYRALNDLLTEARGFA